MNTFVLNFLNVRKSEASGLVLMIFHAFFNGLGIALAYTAINILIIDKKMVSSLPYIYIITSALLLICGNIYARMEHKYQPVRIFRIIILIGFIWSSLLFLNFSLSDSVIMVTIAFTSYFLIYLLNNLEFWGVAAMIFNVRQGKRLFGMLSVGESLAKIIGYSLTPLVISLLDIQYVFLVVAISYAASFLIFRYLERIYRHQLHHEHDHEHHIEAEEHNTKGSFLHMSLKRILNIDDFTKYVSIFAMVATISYFLLQYTFLDQIKFRFTNLDEIAVFFALLFSVAKLLNLLIKLFISGRLLHYMGLKFVMLLLPVVLLISASLGLVGLLNTSPGSNYLIWIFSIIIVLDETFRSSLYTPSYLLLFQPLTKEKRLAGHTLSKGIMEPIGIGIAGFIILFMFLIGKFQLNYLLWIILSFLVIWIISGNQVFKAYLGVLRQALKTKVLNRGTLNLSKEEVLFLRDKLNTSTDPSEIIYALNLLRNELNPEETIGHINQLLANPDPIISSSGILMCGDYHLTSLVPAVQSRIEDKDERVVNAAILVFCQLTKEQCIDFFQRNYNTLRPSAQRTALSSILKYGGLHGAIHFGTHLLQMIESPNATFRANGAKIIQNIGIKEFYLPLIKLLNDTNIEVRKAAIIAASKINHPDLIEPVLRVATEKSMFRYGKKTISSMPPEIIPVILKKMDASNQYDKVRLLRLINKRKEKAIENIIFKQLESPSFEVRKEAIHSIFSRVFLLNSEHERQIRTSLSEILNALNKLIKFKTEVDSPLLSTAISNEIYKVNLPLLYQCLGYLYPKHMIREIIDNANIVSKDYRSNAIELLENVLNGKDKREIIPILEKVYEGKEHRSISKNSKEEFIMHVLNDGNHHYSSWLTAICIRETEDDPYNTLIIPIKIKQLEHKLIRQEIARSQILKEF